MVIKFVAPIKEGRTTQEAEARNLISKRQALHSKGIQTPFLRNKEEWDVIKQKMNIEMSIWPNEKYLNYPINTNPS